MYKSIEHLSNPKKIERIITDTSRKAPSMTNELINRKGLTEQIKDIEPPVDGYFTIEHFNEILKDVCLDDMSKTVIIHTGDKGLDNFDIATIICSCSHEELKEAYRKTREQLYNTKKDYYRLTHNKLIKLLIWLKIIK